MGKKLLLADDSVTIQKVVGISFASEDVELVTVDNGDDAVARARETRPDVVLADVVMPGLNGYEVCEALQSDPDLRHTPVLLLTGTFESFDEERAARCGAAGHIAKPFEAQALVDRVRALLARVPAPDSGQALPEARDVQDTDQALPGSNTSVFSFGQTGEADAIGSDPDRTVAMMQEALSPALPTPPPDSERPAGAPVETAPPDLAQGTLLDPNGASGFDVSASDLGNPLADPLAMPGEAAEADPFAMPGEAAEADPFAMPGEAAEADPFAMPGEAAEADPFAMPGEDPDADFLGTAGDGPLFASEEAPQPTDDDTAAPPSDAAGTAGEPMAATELISDAEALDSTHDVSALAGAALAEVEPKLRENLHDTLEKIAWESLGDLSEQIVSQAVARVEQIAWEVIPELAERLIREEIRRMKGGRDD